MSIREWNGKQGGRSAHGRRERETERDREGSSKVDARESTKSGRSGRWMDLEKEKNEICFVSPEKRLFTVRK
jgi:hypothetical protein